MALCPTLEEAIPGLARYQRRIRAVCQTGCRYGTRVHTRAQTRAYDPLTTQTVAVVKPGPRHHTMGPVGMILFVRRTGTVGRAMPVSTQAQFPDFAHAKDGPAGMEPCQRDREGERPEKAYEKVHGKRLTQEFGVGIGKGNFLSIR